MTAVDVHCWGLYLGAQLAARTAPRGAIALVLAAEARVPEGALHERDPAIGLQRGATSECWGPVHGFLTRHHAITHEAISASGFPRLHTPHHKCAAMHVAALIDLRLMWKMQAPPVRRSLGSSTSGSLPGRTRQQK